MVLGGSDDKYKHETFELMEFAHVSTSGSTRLELLA